MRCVAQDVHSCRHVTVGHIEARWLKEIGFEQRDLGRQPAHTLQRDVRTQRLQHSGPVIQLHGHLDIRLERSQVRSSCGSSLVLGENSLQCPGSQRDALEHVAWVLSLRAARDRDRRLPRACAPRHPARTAAAPRSSRQSRALRSFRPWRVVAGF
jgi:hypothetical protein